MFILLNCTERKLKMAGKNILSEDKDFTVFQSLGKFWKYLTKKADKIGMNQPKLDPFLLFSKWAFL